ncbi:hypothetical protein Tco_0724172 [Tanacetum coccineum]
MVKNKTHEEHQDHWLLHLNPQQQNDYPNLLLSQYQTPNSEEGGLCADVSTGRCSCTPSTSSNKCPEKEVLAVLCIDDVDIEEMDINWQIAMIAIRMKKFYKKTGRRVRVDGKTPVVREESDGFAKMDDGLSIVENHTEVKISKYALMAIAHAMSILCYEEEIEIFLSLSVQKRIQLKTSYSRFTKTNNFKGVPPPLSGDYTPQPQEEIDDALYVYGKKGPQKPEINVSDENSSEHSTCQSNDSEGSCRNTSEHSFETESESLDEPNEMSKSREAEAKRVVNTGNGVTKPVWTNANRINHSNNFVPRSVQLNAGRPKFNSDRPNISTGRTNISSGRSKVNTVSPKVNSVSAKVNTVRPRQTVPNKTSNSLSPKRQQMNQSNQRRDFSKSYSSVRRPFAKSTAQMTHTNAVMGSWGSANVECNGPQGRPKPAKAWGHDSVTKDQLEDFEEFNGGSCYPLEGSKATSLRIKLSMQDFRETNSAGPSIASEEKSQTVNTGRLDHDDSLMPELEIFHKPETGIFDEASYDEEGVITDFNSLPTEIENKSGAHALLSHTQKQQRNNHKDQQHCLFACFLSQEEPKKIAEALQDDSWVQAMQEELLQFKLQQIEAISCFWPLPYDGVHSFTNGVKGLFCYGTIDEEGSTSHAEQGEFFISQDSNSKDFSSQCCQEDLQVSQGQTKLGLMKLWPLITTEVEYVAAANCCGTSIGIAWMTGRSAKYCDKRNQVGFLRKPDESAGFAEIVDFLRDSNLRNKLLLCSIPKPSSSTLKYNLKHLHLHLSLHSPTTIPTPTPPPIPTLTPPPPIPETEPTPDEHIYKEQSPVYHHFSPPQEKDQGRPEAQGGKSQDDPQILQYKDFGRRYKTEEKRDKGKKVVSSLDFQEEVNKYYGDEQFSTVGTKESTSSQDKGQREGKAPMLSEETPKNKMKANAELSKKHAGTWKLSQLKKLSFEEVKEEFDKLVKQVESFAPISFEATKAAEKILCEVLQTKTPKR